MKPLVPRLPLFSLYQSLTFELYFEMRLAFGHLLFTWQDSNRPFGLAAVNRRVVLSLEAATLGLRRALLFLSHALVSYRRTSLFFVSGTPNDEMSGSALHFYQEELSSLGCGYGLRWVGGLLTNFTSLARTLWRRLGSALGRYRKLAKQKFFLAAARGVKLLDRFPDIVCFLSVSGVYRAALHEAVLLGLPTVAFVDSDVDVGGVAYPIPGNDDSLSGAVAKLSLFKELLTRVLKRSLFSDAADFSPLFVPYDLRRTAQDAAAMDAAVEAVRGACSLDRLVALRLASIPTAPCFLKNTLVAGKKAGDEPFPTNSRRQLLYARLALHYPNPPRHGVSFVCKAAASRCVTTLLAKGLASFPRLWGCGGALDVFKQRKVFFSADGRGTLKGLSRRFLASKPPAVLPLSTRKTLRGVLLRPASRSRRALWVVARVCARGLKAIRFRAQRSRAWVLRGYRVRKFLQLRLTQQLIKWPWASELLVRKRRNRVWFRRPASSVVLGRLCFGRRFFVFPRRRHLRYPPFYYTRFSVRSRWRKALATVFPHLLISPSLVKRAGQGRRQLGASGRGSVGLRFFARAASLRPARLFAKARNRAAPLEPVVLQAGVGHPLRRSVKAFPRASTGVATGRHRFVRLRDSVRKVRRALRKRARSYLIARLKACCLGYAWHRRLLLTLPFSRFCLTWLSLRVHERFRAAHARAVKKWQGLSRCKLLYLIRRARAFSQKWGVVLATESSPLRLVGLPFALPPLGVAHRVRAQVYRAIRGRARRGLLKTLRSVRVRNSVLVNSFCLLRASLLSLARTALRLFTGTARQRLRPRGRRRGATQHRRNFVLVLLRALLKLLQLRAAQARPWRKLPLSHPQAVFFAPLRRPLSFVSSLYANRVWRQARFPLRFLSMGAGLPLGAAALRTAAGVP